MATNDRNKLRGGVSALLSQGPSGISGDGPLELPKRGGRPEKGTAPRFSRKTQKVTSVVFDPDQHECLKRLSLKTGITFKELMYQLIQEGLARYEDGSLLLKREVR